MKDYIRQLLREALEQPLDTSKIEIDVQVINNLLVYLPFYDGVRMGAFRLAPFNNDYKVSEVLLYDKFRGQGIGVGMYRYIIEDLAEQGKKLYSDDNQTPDAKRVWASLIKSGLAKDLGNRTYVSTV
jgi:GNAT superfamily N-acetyltransferase